MSGRTEG